MHLVANLAEAVSRVALTIVGAEGRKDLIEGYIAIPEVLELDQLGDQRVELAFVLGRRHQEQDAVEVALLGDNALFAQVVGHHRGGHPEVEVFAGQTINARREECQLVRIDHRIPV